MIDKKKQDSYKSIISLIPKKDQFNSFEELS